MGYTKVRSMGINFNKRTVTGSYASSNVFPITYESVKFEAKNDQEFMEELKAIFNDIVSGMLQFNFSSTSKARWAYLKSIENLSSDIQKDLYHFNKSREAYDKCKSYIRTSFTYEKAQKIYSETFAKFINYLTEKQNKEKGYIKIDSYYLYSVDKDGFPHKYSYLPTRKYTEAQYLDMKLSKKEVKWIC